MQIRDVLLEQTPPAAQPAAAPVAQPGAVKNVQQAAAQTRGQQTQGMLNVQALKQLLPGVDGTKLTQAMTAVKSGAMTAAHYQILGMAFQQLVQADPNTTVKVMNLLKKVQQESVAEAGIMDYAKALVGKTPGTQGMTLKQRATAVQGNAAAEQLGVALGDQWAKKSAQIQKAAQISGKPADPKYLETNLRDMVNRVAFKGKLDQLDATAKSQADAAIAAILGAGLDPAASKKAWKNLGVVASAATIPTQGRTAARTTAQPAAAPAQQPAQQTGATAQPAAAPAQPAAPDAAQIIANLEKTVPKDVLMSVAAELLKKYTSRATPK
jgi:hypothetical protein